MQLCVRSGMVWPPQPSEDLQARREAEFSRYGPVRYCWQTAFVCLTRALGDRATGGGAKAVDTTRGI